MPNPRGVFVAVGHRPLHVGRTVLSALADENPNIRLMMTVRLAQDRLESLFRGFWRLSLEAGVEDLAKTYSASLMRSGANLGRLARSWLRPSARASASTHQERTCRDAAIEMLHYSSVEKGEIGIDAGAWLESYSKQGSACTYWMHDFCDPTNLRRSVANGSVELVRPRSIDAIFNLLFEMPAGRTNVSIHAPHPEVVRAIDGAQALFEWHAASDAAFEGTAG
jgi:hypothetical protein